MTMKKLIALRKETPALSSMGDIEFLNRNYGGYPLIYTRTCGNDKYLVCLNPLDKVEEFEICASGCEVVMQNNSVEITDNKVVLAPVSYAIIKMN